MLDYDHSLASRLQFCPSDEPMREVELSQSHMREHTFSNIIQCQKKKCISCLGIYEFGFIEHIKNCLCLEELTRVDTSAFLQNNSEFYRCV